MNTVFYLFKDGMRDAVTMSYDDGAKHDIRLIDIFNRNHIKGTFHLNSKNLSEHSSWHVPEKELQSLYAGHEVACHGFTHPYLERLPDAQVLQQILEDRKFLESRMKYPVRGLSYPFGTESPRVREIISAAGIVYSRSVGSTMKFNLPEDWLSWKPTCHHREAVEAIKKLGESKWGPLNLLYIWGHSFEFDRENNWEYMEDVCASLKDRPDTWFATNIEIHDYVEALRRLEFTCDSSMVHNPSAVPLWILANDNIVKVGAGELKSLV